MIIIFLGGIGSGKTVSVVKEIIDNNQYAYTNFPLKNFKKYHRIQVSDVVKDDVIEDINGKPKSVKKVNWEFWENVRKSKDNYSIFIDEVHNLIHSRRSMSKTNILMSKWISQIRKILQDKKRNNIYLISQTVRKIDVDFRELAQIIIHCKKQIYKGNVYITQSWFNGIDHYEMGRSGFKRRFIANKYFKYYDTENLVTFEDTEEYI